MTRRFALGIAPYAAAGLFAFAWACDVFAPWLDTHWRWPVRMALDWPDLFAVFCKGAP